MALGLGWIPMYPSLLTIKGGLIYILIEGIITTIKNIKGIPAPTGIIIIGDGLERTKPFLDHIGLPNSSEYHPSSHLFFMLLG